MFKKADLDMDGFVSGQEIRNIFLQSGLSNAVLAHIWNLCDTKSMGKLNSEQFALAMYLVQQKVKGPYSHVADFSAIKELGSISKDIEDIKRQKLQLEREKAQSEADIKISQGEVQSLQKELESITATLHQLENQKKEAQKRLDALDEKIDDLKQQMNNQAKSVKVCDQDVRFIVSLVYTCTLC
ncbi:hypothetical protein KUTeg_017153 [Tegillarca granosa]|uniref:Epidermal growth factor receptor substrate 15-like 1 n=1 Tax=Tegillarca granosa TaxID=220873 RepID=A0ABQ9EMY7_TEGGR|nr:hypothetical protein KUTeg_017153 [Tegillarca granosa]